MIDKFQNAKFIFVVGIGGSDLAGKAVWNAMTLHKMDINKKVFFIESPDSREYEEIKNFVSNEIASPEEMVLIVVSKSGGTLETLEAFHKTSDILVEKFGLAVNGRMLVISTEGTPFWKMAEERGIERLAWQGDIGGRFSTFTVAHTTALSLAGLDTNAFLSGGREADENRAASLAKNIFDNYGSTNSPQVNVLDFFIFNSELEDLGKWCRQLIAESLGKKNDEGKEVGITPTVSIGPVDLHSMLQLDLGGPKNRFTIFVRSLKEIKGGVNETAYENTVKAYGEAGLPFEKYEIPEINEYELGKFMAIMMNTTIELAKLLGVNPYNQPAVEEYKEHIRND